MSTQTITKKRKSADVDASATKKAKVAKSADKPAPVKSALKKPAVEKKTEVKIKTKPKPMTIEAHEVKRSKPTAKLAKPAKKAEKIITQDNSNGDDGSNTLTADQTASLLAGFSSESEGEGSDEKSDIPDSKLPKAPTQGDIQDRIADAVKSASDSTKNNDPETTPGTIYLGRIPHGFHEPQMRSYFSQFGTITHLKLARNRKTGKSKHFAFIEFASAAVADIVAKTMDKYLLFGHILQVRRVPQESMGANVWKGEGRRGWNVRPNNKIERGALRRGKTREAWEKKAGQEERRRSAKEEKLREMGYEFEMPSLKAVDAVPKKGAALEEAGAGAENEVPEHVAEETVVAGEGNGEAVTEKKTTKKRVAEGKPKVKEAKKAVKKVKT